MLIVKNIKIFKEEINMGERERERERERENTRIYQRKRGGTILI